MKEQYSWRQLGAVSEDLTALASFFDHPWDRPIQSLPPYSKALVLGQSALYLLTVGRLQEAVVPMQEAARLMPDVGDWEQATISAGNLSELHMSLGNLMEACQVSEMALSFARKSGITSQVITRLSQAAGCLCQCGDWYRSSEYLDEAEAQVARLGVTPALLFGMPGSHYCDRLLAGLERGSWEAFLACGLAPLRSDRNLDPTRHDQFTITEGQVGSMRQLCAEIVSRTTTSQSRLQGRMGHREDAFDHLTLARAALYRAVLEPVSETSDSEETHCRPKEQLQQVRAYLANAMTCFLSARQSQHTPRGLLTFAWLHFLQHDTTAAQADLDEAWDIAERGPMRLHMADIHLHRARLFFREKHYPWKSPQDDLAAAEKLINECGYHRRDEELADAKCAILQMEI